MFFTSAVGLGVSATYLSIWSNEFTKSNGGRSPVDDLRAARRAYLEAYAAYLDTAPINSADVYLQPEIGLPSRRRGWRS
jgi:hypothetical protein